MKRWENSSDCNPIETATEDIATVPPPKSWLSITFALLPGGAARIGIITISSQAVNSATNFLTGVIIGRACGKEQFGLYMLGFSIVLFVMNVQNSLISTPYMVYSPRLSASGHTRYAGSTLINQLGLSALAMLGLALGGGLISLGIGPQELEPVMWALVTVIAFIMLREYARRVCFAGLRMATALLVDMCVAVVQVSGLLLLAYLDDLSASRAYCVIGTACGLVALGWLIWSCRDFAFSLDQVTLDLARNWSFGKWIFASAMTWVMSANLYPWFLTTFYGTAETGIWAACIGIVALANPVFLGVGNLFGPKTAHAFAAEGPGKLRRTVIGGVGAFGLVIGPFCILAILFGGPLVVLAYGNEFADNGVVVSILALNLLVSGVAFAFSSGLIVMERAKLDFMSNLLALALTFTVGLWFTKSFGVAGAAIAFLAATGASSVAKYLLFNREINAHSR